MVKQEKQVALCHERARWVRTSLWLEERRVHIGCDGKGGWRRQSLSGHWDQLRQIRNLVFSEAKFRAAGDYRVCTWGIQWRFLIVLRAWMVGWNEEDEKWQWVELGGGGNEHCNPNSGFESFNHPNCPQFLFTFKTFNISYFECLLFF